MISIALSDLNNQELLTIGKRVKDILKGVDTNNLGIDVYVQNYVNKFDLYEESYNKEEVSAAVIAQKDARCDDYYIALRNHVTNFQYHPDKNLRKKANEILKVLNKDGNRIYNLGYKTESAYLARIINTIDKKYLDDLDELMGAIMWYTLLKEAHTDFEATVKEVTTEKAKANAIASASDTRYMVEDALRKLFMFIPLQYEMTKAPELSDLTGQLQAVADRF